MMTDIQTIENSEMLTNDYIEALTSVGESIDEGFSRRQRFRPRFLMETAVLNDMKFPTPDAKYWQCNVERDTHFRNLVMLSFDYREKIADIEILDEEIKSMGNFNKGLRTKKSIQVERENALLLYMKKEAQERVREIMNWSEIMQELEPSLKYDPIDTEAHMPEAYAIRAGREQEMMKLAEGQSDMSGAMNILSVGMSMIKHPSVQLLIEEAQKKKQLKEGEDDGKEIC